MRLRPASVVRGPDCGFDRAMNCMGTEKSERYGQLCGYKGLGDRYLNNSTSTMKKGGYRGGEISLDMDSRGPKGILIF